MEHSLQSQSVVNVKEKHQQNDHQQEQQQVQKQQQQPVEEHEEFRGNIRRDEKSDDEEEEEDGDVDEPALKKPKLPPRSEGYSLKLKRAQKAAAKAAAAGSADDTADPSATTAAAATSPEKLVQVAIDFLEKVAIDFPNCLRKSVGRTRPMSCSCLSSFRRTAAAESPNQVTLNTARYMVYFQQLRIKEQYQLFIKWILAARQRAQQLKEQLRQGHKVRRQHVVYTLPSFDTDGGSGTTTTDNNNGPPFFICQSALLRILDKGPEFWITCRNAADAGGALPVHGLAEYRLCRRGKFEQSGGDFEAKSFLEGMMEFATRTSETMVCPHDGKTHEILELDATVTKRELYIEYAFERGWIVTRNSDRTWTKKEREADQYDWNPAHKKVIMSQATFKAFWLKFFPYLRVVSQHWKQATANRHTRPCQGLSGGHYAPVIQASAVEALIAAVRANGSLPRTFPLAPSLEGLFENYGMVEVRAEEENTCKEEQGMTAANNNNNKEHYVIRSKACDGVGTVRRICRSCNQVSQSIANLRVRLAIQSSTPSCQQR